MMTKTDNIYGVFDGSWALLTAGTEENYNTMTISWGGMGTLWGKKVATVYVRPNRYRSLFPFWERLWRMKRVYIGGELYLAVKYGLFSKK